MSLSFGLSPWLLALCLLMAAGLTYWTYKRSVPRVSMGRRALLMSLRMGALFLILLLLFEPIWRQFQQEDQPPVLAVLVDDSQSLTLTPEESLSPDLPTATRAVVSTLPLNSVGGDSRLFSFSNTVSPLSTPDSLRFEGSRTNIAQALDFARDELADENLRGVLLLSDGQSNTGRNPIYLAERYPVPIFTIALGDTTRHRDIQIRRVTTNEIAYVDTELPLQVGIRAEDFADEQVAVTLIQQGQVLSNQTIQLPEGASEVEVDLSFTPTTEGYQQLTVAVTELPGEVTYRNNSETFTVRVLENKRRILLLGAAPSPDVAAIRTLLQGDPQVDVSSFVQKQRGTFYEGAPPTSFESYDAIVLVGYPGRFADPTFTQQVVAATESTPTLFMLTRQTDLNILRTQFEAVLPVLPVRRRQTFAEASFVTTPRGLQHPILETNEDQSRLRQLPPLYYNESRWEASPDARVLATIDVRGIALDDPMLVVRERSGSRTAALLGAGTWRWQNLPEDLETLTPFWPRVFANLMQWLTTPEDNRRVRVQPVTDIFNGNEAVSFGGQVYDESLQPINDASLTLKITAPDDTEFPYTMNAVGNGRYVLDVGSLPEGTYRFEAEAERRGGILGGDQGTFAVGALALEFKETRADVAVLRQIAQRSGGAFLTAEMLPTLPDLIRQQADFEPVVYEDLLETKLWHIYWFLAAIMVLLTLEWFFRKRSGMV